MRRLMHVMNVRPQVAVATHSRSQICDPSARRASSVPRSLPTWLAAEPVRSWPRQLSRPDDHGSFGDAQPGRVACVFIGGSSRASGGNCRRACGANCPLRVRAEPGATRRDRAADLLQAELPKTQSRKIRWHLLEAVVPRIDSDDFSTIEDGGSILKACQAVDGRARLVDAQGLLA